MTRKTAFVSVCLWSVAMFRTDDEEYSNRKYRWDCDDCPMKSLVCALPLLLNETESSHCSSLPTQHLYGCLAFYQAGPTVWNSLPLPDEFWKPDNYQPLLVWPAR